MKCNIVSSLKIVLQFIIIECMNTGVFGKVGVKCKKNRDCEPTKFPRELCHKKKCHKRCRVDKNCKFLKGAVCGRIKDERGKRSKSKRVCCKSTDSYTSPKTGHLICGLVPNGEACSTGGMCESGFCGSDGSCIKEPIFTPAGIGAACETHDMCQSGHCSIGGICHPGTDMQVIADLIVGKWIVRQDTFEVDNDLKLSSSIFSTMGFSSVSDAPLLVKGGIDGLPYGTFTFTDGAGDQLIPEVGFLNITNSDNFFLYFYEQSINGDSKVELGVTKDSNGDFAVSVSISQRLRILARRFLKEMRRRVLI